MGGEGGFFSEFNNMVLSILYCLESNITFSIYSKDANFGYDKGWQDYFLPFCDEYGNQLHSLFNRRPNPRFKMKALSQIYDSICWIFRKINPSVLTTADLWNEIRRPPLDKKYTIKELGIDGDLLQACNKIIELIWKYQPDVERKINDMRCSLNINTPYFGFHIRGGDKFIEADLIKPSDYVEKAKRISSDIKTAFVLTDDYRVIKDLTELYTDWTFHTFCAPTERGYFHKDFQKSSKEFKRDSHIKLFASMDVLADAEQFIGTFSSNPGMYLGMRMPKGKAVSLDVENWCIW
jgi:hypothetical protein